MDVNLVVNSSSVRSNTTSTSVARFNCIVNAIPPAMVAWEYNRDAGNDSIQDPRITIDTRDSNGTVVSDLTFTAVEVSYRGNFTCTATNLVGFVSSSAYLRIFGELTVVLCICVPSYLHVHTLTVPHTCPPLHINIQIIIL